MEPLWSRRSHHQRAMDCTAAILKACARSRSKWCRHKRSARTTLGCCWGCCRGGAAPAVIGDASSFLHRLLVYICCCRSSEESSELCREWVDPPVAESGRGEDEGESKAFCWATRILVIFQPLFPFFFMLHENTSMTSTFSKFVWMPKYRNRTTT